MQGSASESDASLPMDGWERFHGRVTGSFGKARSAGGWGLGASAGVSWLGRSTGVASSLPPVESDTLGGSFRPTAVSRSSHLSTELFGGTAWDTEAGSLSVHVYGQFERTLDVQIRREADYTSGGNPVGREDFIPNQTGLTANRWVAFVGARSEVREAW